MAQFVNVNSQEFDDELLEQYGYDSGDDSYSDDDSESLGSFIDAGMRTVGNIVGGGVNPARNVAGSVLGGVGKILGVNPSSASTAGIQGSSNLSGSIQSSTGRQIPFRLPPTVSTKQDIDILRGAISKINNEIKAVADAGNNNATALTKLTKEVAAVDSKHTLATKTQNKYISTLGKSVDTASRGLKEMRSQAQMQMMMSMMMQPKLTGLKLGAPDATTKVSAVEEAIYSGNNDMLLMMMMGGFGGDGGSGGDMMNNPLMMMLMMDSFK